MTVGFFSPLPPARTGVAEYSRALLEGLRTLGDVRLNASSANVCLYHLGNNALHRAIYKAALAQPGVVVLHDAVLHHFLLGTLGRDAYIEEFVYNYGEWSRGLAAELWEGRPRSAQDARYFDYPMLRRAAESARAVIVHNPAAARRVRAHAPDARIYEIPHLFAQPPLPGAAAVRRWRERHGVGPSTFLFGVLGHLRESKRMHSVLAAFAALAAEGLDTKLLIAGDFVSSDLERALAPCLSGPGILRAPHLNEAEFWLSASALDACVNLRYPAAGETSGIAIRLMGIGKPVMMTASEEVSRFPETACVKIDAGVDEQTMLREYMRLLVTAPETARDIGRRAAEHIAAHHGAAAAARRYWEILCAHSWS